MSDHHIEVEPNSKYIFSIYVKADSKMIIHLGIACYDKFKNVILPVQVKTNLFLGMSEIKY